ncbi:hypothetical protein [Aquimarina celericrescens]|uniref:TIR domain-containing protein n=1 Tax=Aquimarina celericrescens TaxID=1964542 RepID=A0ABW5B201_9FLAO|nr:hypothetical protein [Aquimarina celericrescens]
MSIIPQYGLKQYRNTARIYTKSVTESLRLFKEEPRNIMVSVFIFHKHDELEELDSAINFLNGFDELVYADWIDEDMYDNTTEATKRIHLAIKEKMKQNKKFIFLATEYAIESKLGKWVLGQLHGQKDTEHIALFPVRGDYSDYSGEEYLQKYPYIHEIEAEVYGVKYPNGEAKELGAWLAS